ncbi:hypothetical protein [Erwinia mallotivora]|uniref:hypothetical protein n=1 Tax=Erwinia mallotivora TaxID=69222 RepID=UPI0021BF70CE|nr:hypothetical protein [Erwinia mallotivora]
MDILDGWHVTLVLLYLGALALTLKPDAITHLAMWLLFLLGFLSGLECRPETDGRDESIWFTLLKKDVRSRNALSGRGLYRSLVHVGRTSCLEVHAFLSL